MESREPFDDGLDEADLADEQLHDDDELDGGIVPDDYDDDLDDLDDDDDESDDDLDDDDEAADVDDDFDDDFDDDDDYEDATADEIDFVAAFYREDGEPVVMELSDDCANDLDELIAQLRRLPGDVGAVGAVSIAGEFFVLCRVRGRNVQVVLNDSIAANDWPIARDVVDYLGEDVPDPDDDSEIIGDLGMLTDLGISEFDLEQIAGDLDEDSDQLVAQMAQKMKFGAQFDKLLD